jgi:hypothetical protein
VPGKPARRFPSLKNVSRDWKVLTWLGFCSMGQEKRSFYLDNLVLKNEAAAEERL